MKKSKIDKNEFAIFSAIRTDREDPDPFLNE